MKKFSLAFVLLLSVMTIFGQTVTLTFTGRDANNFVETRCTTSLQKNDTKNNAKGTATHPFSFGDQMEYVGYATINGIEIESQRIQQMQGASQTFTLQFDVAVPVPVDGQPCPNAATVTDYDGNTYNTVQIGQQCWMKQNLRTTRYADGTSISLGSSTSTTTAYRYYPNDNSGNVSTYGYLYNWKAVMGNSSSSSSTSTCAVGNNPSGNNATGFSAVPAGYYYGYYSGFGNNANFWSATQDYSYYAYYRVLGNDNDYVSRDDNNKSLGVSVRCLRN